VLDDPFLCQQFMVVPPLITVWGSDPSARSENIDHGL